MKKEADTHSGVPAFGAEGGIRTLEELMTLTRFPIVRARPTTRLLHVWSGKGVLNCQLTYYIRWFQKSQEEFAGSSDNKMKLFCNQIVAKCQKMRYDKKTQKGGVKHDAKTQNE